MQALFSRVLASTAGTKTPAMGGCGSFYAIWGAGLHYREAGIPDRQERVELGHFSEREQWKKAEYLPTLASPSYFARSTLFSVPRTSR